MEYQIKYENGIANHGNLYRLKKVMDRAKAMRESVERHHNLVWHVQKMICSRRSRIL